MTKLILLVELICLALVVGCSGNDNHFIKDTDDYKTVAHDFKERMNALYFEGLYDWYESGDLTLYEREAMMFLYAYMPAGDATDYDSNFYINNIRATKRAYDEMPWCKTVPEKIFRHFVLPVRVNNEALDSSRTVFYNELKDRVKNLSMAEAALEVNHWCHEKVIYAPSDARTSSPLATVFSAYGRCGEEAVFAVAALRAVGIPARQVYTPRWAHTDDNHAWVEVWVDGKWYFMGACEPEPVLNMAWFNSPARRSMFMHTKAFGNYKTDEETVDRTGCYTEINVTANYAPVARLTAVVTDTEGNPVKGANVEFKLYNYAEFYTVARHKSNEKGEATITAGKGDMLVWAYANGQFGFAKASFGKEDRVVVKLDRSADSAFEAAIDIMPPVEGTIPVEVTEEQKANNAKRLTEEDQIRTQYTKTFLRYESPKALQGQNRTLEDRMASLLSLSRGNHEQIKYFFDRADNKEAAVALLENISQKDLRDARADILADHLNSQTYRKDDAYIKYIQNPRISNESLTSYKTALQNNIPSVVQDGIKVDSRALVEWVNAYVRLAPELNPQRIPMSPFGVLKSRVADARSRDIFFVAVARTMGIPSRIDPVTNAVQYSIDGHEWINVNFESSETVAPERGYLKEVKNPSPKHRDPEYYTHFTIAKIKNDGSLQTLDFESEVQVDMGAGATWSNLIGKAGRIEAGNYILVSGSRMAKGNVLANIRSFNVKPEQTTTLDLVMRENRDDVRVIGNVDAEATFLPYNSDTPASILATTGRGYFVIGLLGLNQEPTNHALRDIAAYAKEFQGWGRAMIFLFKDEGELNQFKYGGEFGNLPATVSLGVDTKGSIAKMISTGLDLTDARPVFVIADTFGRVVFLSQGYTIGVGALMLETINKL